MTRFARFACWSLAIIAVFVVGWAGWWMWLAHEFESRVEELRAAGHPVTPADLARPPIPEEQNAAPLLLEADAWYQNSSAPTALEWLETENWTDDDRRDVEAWLAEAVTYLDLLEAAARLGSAQFDLRWEDGPAMELTFLPILLDAAHVLEIAATIDIERGRPDRAIDRVETMLGLSDLVDHRLAVIVYQLQQNLRILGLQVLERVMNAGPVDAARVRARVDPKLRIVADNSRLIEVLRAERAWMLDLVRRRLAGEPMRQLIGYYVVPTAAVGVEEPSPPSLSVWSWSVMRPFAYRDGIEALDLMSKSIRACERGGDSVAASLSAISDEAGSLPVPRYLAAVLWRSIPSKGLKYRQEYVAEVRVARVGLAVHEYRQRHGRWPARLDDVADLLGGQVPLDPFGDKPFRYEADEGQAKITADRPVPDEALRDELEIAWVVR